MAQENSTVQAHQISGNGNGHCQPTRTIAAARLTSEIPLELAKEFRLRYYDSNLKQSTECVVHDYARLQQYINNLSQVFAENPGPPDSKRGVALYFSESLDGNLFYKKGSNTSYLLRGEATVVLIPVYYTETEKKIFFPYVIIDGQPQPGDFYTVSRLNVLDSPLDPDSRLSDKFLNKVNMFFETEGFDLGHTHP